jgi:hypothetical protein
MTRVITVTPQLLGLTQVEMELPSAEAERLRALQEAIGGYLELVKSRRTPGLWLFVNEDGHRLNMPDNPVATTLAGTHIIGPVVLHGGPGMDGELLSIPARLAEIVMSAARIT